MGNHAKCFDTRKASAEETARWLLPEYHRAQNNQEQKVNINTKDLGELLSYIESVRHRDEVQFAGKHLGYCDPEAMRALMSREKPSINILFKATRRFCTPVTFRELPVKVLPVGETEGEKSAVLG